MNNIQYKSAAVLFGGIGGESVGLLRSQIEYGGKLYKFKLLCSIDYDSVACQNHDIITGSKTSRVMDLFTREQYIAWNGHEPPADWTEVTPWDMWQAFGEEVPFFLFTSPPCKGLSGLLPEKSAKSVKYQALNELTLRGLELSLLACMIYGDGLPAIIQLENVPRIQTRGKKLLYQIETLLKKFGYAVNMSADHNLGEIGGLGQNRVRFLIMSRLEKVIPNFIYYPLKKRMQTIGDVLSKLPLPGDTLRGGPHHNIQRLQMKTWKRLALIPPGGDWRDLNKVDWRNLCIAPIEGGSAQPLIDPKLKIGSDGKTNLLRIQSAEEPAFCITGAAGPYQGGACLADPRTHQRDITKFQIKPITDTPFGSKLIEDPKLGCSPRADSFGVQDWNQPAKTVIGSSDVHASAAAVADPRIPEDTERGVDRKSVV